VIAKLAKHKEEERNAEAESHPDESPEERRQRILRQKMRIHPRRTAAEKRRGEKTGTTD
jgi:hypothetical protein